MMTTTQTHEEMIAALVAKLPATKCCPKCKQNKPVKEGFGLRTSYKGERVVRVQVQSYCRDCRGGKTPVAAAPVINNWNDAVLVALGGSKPTKLADLYTTVEQMVAMKDRIAGNKNWKAKIRQVCQALAKKNQVKSPSVGVWQLSF